MHGGKPVTGATNPSFKSGRYSRYLPSELDTIYRESLANPDLVEMSDHIALLEARMQHLLGSSATGDPVPKWGQVREMFATLATAVLSGETDEVNPALEQMQAVIDAGVKWDTTWNQVMETMEQLRKLTDTEVKRKKELHQMIPVERVVVMMAAVANAVKRNVKDPDQIAAVYRELDMLYTSDRVPARPNQLRAAPTDLRTPNERSRARRKATKAIDVGVIEVETGTF